MSDQEKLPDNPTKAIAVKQMETSDAPKITAKGEGKLAERILDIAFTEGVKVRQDRDLTELLDAFDVDSPVPLEALHAVSLILERVYAENKRLQEEKEQTMDPTPDIDAKRDTQSEQTIDGAFLHVDEDTSP